MESKSSPDLSFPTRPAVSSKFKANSIELVSNHFNLKLASTQPSIYLFDVKIIETESGNPISLDARTLRQSVIKKAYPQLKAKFGDNLWYSGQMLWSPKNYKDPQTIEARVDNLNYAVICTFARETNLKAEAFKDNLVAAPALQYLNILIKRYFKEKKYVEWGMNAKFYDPEEVQSIPEFYIEIYRGYKTSTQVYKGFTPKVLIDFSSRILRSDNALFYIKECSSNEDIREMLIGRSVVASYGNFRMWRVDEIDFRLNPTSTFEGDDRQNISFEEYYKTKYNIVIKDRKQPLLVSINRKRNKIFYLVPELVQMTGLSDDMRADFNLMKRVAEYTRLNPTARMQQIEQAVTQIRQFFKSKYDIELDKESVVKGYVLNAPQLTLGRNKAFTPAGNYQLRDPIFRPASFDKWLFVYAENCKDDAKYFLETLKKCSGAYAIHVANPNEVSIREREPKALKTVLQSKIKGDTQIVVVLYPPAAKKTWYKAMKDVCFTEFGVPCQAIVSKSLQKNAMSVCSKLLLQMNAKLGLELWVTQRPEGLPEKTMIIGADVYHNTKIGDERRSCVGFCASLNSDFTKFYSKVKFQSRVGEEIMLGIGTLVKEAVLKYFAFNNKKFLPETIIFFRDGVAENQIRTALEIETKAILEQLKSINPDYEPKFAEILITKRIDDRIFVDADKSGGARVGGGGRGGANVGRFGGPGGAPKNYTNPPAGTVVADSIVSNNFDYLLVSQDVNQGTCTPTHYNVIYNTTDLPQEVFWQLSYSQSYNYYNWNGSVRVPAPVQYAHKLAYLVGQTVRSDVQPKLDQTLYYL